MVKMMIDDEDDDGHRIQQPHAMKSNAGQTNPMPSKATHCMTPVQSNPMQCNPTKSDEDEEEEEGDEDADDEEDCNEEDDEDDD
eukprot:2235905-Karenia_brevis.AAC.1